MCGEGEEQEENSEAGTKSKINSELIAVGREGDVTTPVPTSLTPLSSSHEDFAAMLIFQAKHEAHCDRSPPSSLGGGGGAGSSNLPQVFSNRDGSGHFSFPSDPTLQLIVPIVRYKNRWLFINK